VDKGKKPKKSQLDFYLDDNDNIVYYKYLKRRGKLKDVKGKNTKDGSVNITHGENVEDGVNGSSGNNDKNITEDTNDGKMHGERVDKGHNTEVGKEDIKRDDQSDGEGDNDGDAQRDGNRNGGEDGEGGGGTIEGLVKKTKR
jgi:hypothetical protein